jgi:ATP/maltotriose-dependent transcriptional regulator MalT/DNA-binding SARP family transcriptional activator
MKPKRVSLGKTTRPSLPGILPRQRLFALLDEGRRRPAIWVAGPPGCGKTTAVASYLDHTGIPCLWYQLDEGDGDVATFFYYLGLAAAEHAEAGDAPLPLLTPEYQPGLAVFTRRYFQSLYARLKAPFAVVFDGYHEVSAFSQFHEVMRDALAELPPGGGAILISRSDPPGTFARLRANRALAMLEWEDLRLTREETGSIALQRLPGLAPETLEDLYTKTQGWAAGLVLMLEQSKMLGAIAEPPDLSTSQPVFDYLAGEIFEKSDAPTRDFLLRTAYLPQMTSAVARSLSGVEDAERILEELHRNRYFVTRRQARPEPVYQYHPMFREFLLSRAQEEHPKDRRRALQKQAAALMESAGHADDALTLYRDSREWDEMARVIAAHAEAMLAQGRGETIVRWIEDLPPEARDRHPWIVYWAASSQAQRAPREARLLYEKAFELFRAQAAPDVTGMVLAASGAMDAILYELDDFSLLDRWIAALDEAEKSGVRFPSSEVEARVACSMVFSLTLRQPQRRDLERWVERALACARNVTDPNLKMFVGLLSSLTLMWTGLFDRALTLIEAMRRASASPGVTPFSLITLKNVEAMYYMLTADREHCLAAVREGLDTARATGVHTWTFQLLVHGYGGALAEQALDKAAEFARELEAHTAGAGRLNLCLYHHFQGWEAMLRRDLMRALREERAALQMAVECGCPYFEALCRLALAEVLAECGDERKSVAHLQQLRHIVESINNRHLEFACLIGFGRLALEHGRPRPGLTALRRAFALGREYGYNHFLWWRPAAVARACAYALEAGIEPEYVRSLIRRRGLAPEQPPLLVEGWPWMFRVRVLGGFELLKHDQPFAASGKAQKRPLELLKVLVAYGGERVSEASVTEAMWPRIDGDSAHRSFTSTLHRLRKLLGEDKAVLLHEGRLTLDRRYFWVDAWAFEQLVGEIDAAFKRSRASLEAAQVEGFADKMLMLYRGALFGADSDEAWQVQPRERMRNRFIRVMTEIGRYWEEGGEWDRALACYEKCLEADPQAEGFYRHSMICFQRLDRRAEAIEIFNRCRKALASLGVGPSGETQALYERLIAAR